MSSAEPWTIGRLLAWTQDYLKRRGSETPRLDAEVLLAFARGSSRIELYTSFGDAPPEELLTTFRELVRRRAEGMPVAYLVGHKEFYSLSFIVSPAVLVPRPETELLVLRALDMLKQAAGAQPPGIAEPPELADVGTGSGILACTLAKHADCRITAIDLSADALSVARRNAAKHNVSERIEFVESDLFARVPAERQFDLIVANPPYIPDAEIGKLSRDVCDHEPRIALAGGPTGLEIIVRLIAQAAQRLKQGGSLLMEIGIGQDAAVRNLFDPSEWQVAATTKDLAGIPRVVGARRIG